VPDTGCLPWIALQVKQLQRIYFVIYHTEIMKSIIPGRPGTVSRPDFTVVAIEAPSIPAIEATAKAFLNPRLRLDLPLSIQTLFARSLKRKKVREVHFQRSFGLEKLVFGSSPQDYSVEKWRCRQKFD